MLTYYKGPLATNFAQTCSLISIYNMYTVCGYDTPQRTGQTDWTIIRTRIICVLQVLV